VSWLDSELASDVRGVAEFLRAGERDHRRAEGAARLLDRVARRLEGTWPADAAPAPALSEAAWLEAARKRIEALPLVTTTAGLLLEDVLAALRGARP
jgi:hypothetical protein